MTLQTEKNKIQLTLTIHFGNELYKNKWFYIILITPVNTSKQTTLIMLIQLSKKTCELVLNCCKNSGSIKCTLVPNSKSKSLENKQKYKRK